MRAKVCLFIYLSVHLFAEEEAARMRGVWKPFPSKYLISGPELGEWKLVAVRRLGRLESCVGQANGNESC